MLEFINILFILGGWIYYFSLVFELGQKLFLILFLMQLLVIVSSFFLCRHYKRSAKFVGILFIINTCILSFCSFFSENAEIKSILIFNLLSLLLTVLILVVSGLIKKEKLLGQK